MGKLRLASFSGRHCGTIRLHQNSRPSTGGLSANMKTTIVILLVCAAAIWFSPTCRLIRSFDHLEQNARKSITGSELQAWVVQVVAQYPAPTNGYMRVRRSELIAALPKPLSDLYHNPPDIFVYETATNSPGHVRLVWGGGMIGHCGFDIGPTNFISAGHRWQDGVYFWSDSQHP